MCFLRLTLFALGCILAVPLVGTADERVQVPFMFTEDQALQNSEILNNITPSTSLQSSKFLTAPFTRLDYILMQMERELNIDDNIEYIKNTLRDGFQKRTIRKFVFDPLIKGTARLNRKIGKLIVGYYVNDLGKPKVPMNKSCHNVMVNLEFKVPQKLLGYWYHNSFLGVLAQDDFNKYTQTLENLSKEVVLAVRLQYADERAIFSLTCWKERDGAPLRFQNDSFRIPPRR